MLDVWVYVRVKLLRITAEMQGSTYLQQRRQSLAIIKALEGRCPLEIEKCCVIKALMTLQIRSI